MLAKIISLLSLVFISLDVNSQGHIEHIKNQEYLKYRHSVDCNNLPGDNLSERICANLAFQKSDSLLVVVYTSLLSKARIHYKDSLEFKLIRVQAVWRKFRDQHCGLIFDSYENCGSCHQRSIAYLNCLKELTDDRIKELERMSKQIAGE